MQEVSVCLPSQNEHGVVWQSDFVVDLSGCRVLAVVVLGLENHHPAGAQREVHDVAA